MFSDGKTILKTMWSPAEDAVSAGTEHDGSVGAAARRGTGIPELPPPAPRGSLAINTLEAFFSYPSLLELK